MRLLLQCLLSITLSAGAVLLLDLEVYATIAVAAIFVIGVIVALRTYDEHAPMWIWLSYVIVMALFFGITWAALPVWFLDENRLIERTPPRTRNASSVDPTRRGSDEEHL